MIRETESTRGVTPATTRAGAYDLVTFDDADRRELHSAEAGLPSLFDVYRPESVLHVGCGAGAWLYWARRYGVEDCVGVDLAHPVDGLTHVPRDQVVVADIRAGFDLGRRFDLVIALEIASRLPVERADTFVDELTAHGDAVLFSAAIPGQVALDDRNEQWPSYWIERFDRRGFVAIDCVRPRWWDDRRIAPEYRQNTFLMVSEVRLAHAAPLRLEHELHAGAPVAVVHPALWVERLGVRERPRVAGTGAGNGNGNGNARRPPRRRRGR
jgi:hypothetical protein